MQFGNKLSSGNENSPHNLLNVARGSLVSTRGSCHIGKAKGKKYLRKWERKRRRGQVFVSHKKEEGRRDKGWREGLNLLTFVRFGITHFVHQNLSDTAYYSLV